MEPRIKFKLVQLGTRVLFQVLELDERFTGWGKTYKDSVLNVSSSNNRTALWKGTVNLRGDGDCRGYNKDDLYVSHFNFSSVSCAEEYYNKVLESLEDWANNWDGWEGGNRKNTFICCACENITPCTISYEFERKCDDIPPTRCAFSNFESKKSNWQKQQRIMKQIDLITFEV